jgi:hypothetical protein
MDNNNILEMAVPLFLVDFFLESKGGVFNIKYDNECFDVNFSYNLLVQYREKFKESSLSYDDSLIPLYIDIIKKEVLSIKESIDRGLLQNVDYGEIEIDIGKGVQYFNILGFYRSLMEDIVFDQKDYFVNIDIGTVRFPNDYIMMILSDYSDKDYFSFLIKEDCSIAAFLIVSKDGDSEKIEDVVIKKGVM